MRRIMQRRARLAFAAAAFAAAAIAGCGGSDGEKAAQPAVAAAVKPPAGLLQEGSLTFGTDFQFPPFEDIVGGKQVGFDVEFGKLVAAQMGLEAKFLDSRFAALIPGLQARKFDAIISGLYVTPDRLKEVAMVPYFNTGNVLVVKQDGGYQPQQPLDLCGHTFSIQEGAYVEEVVRKDVSPECERRGSGAVEVLSFPTDTFSFQQVSRGAADVTYGDVAVTKARLEQHPELGLHVSSPEGELDYPTPGGIAIRKADKDLERAIREAVEALERNGKLDALLERYGLAPADPKQVAKAIRESQG